MGFFVLWDLDSRREIYRIFNTFIFPTSTIVILRFNNGVTHPHSYHSIRLDQKLWCTGTQAGRVFVCVRVHHINRSGPNLLIFHLEQNKCGVLVRSGRCT